MRGRDSIEFYLDGADKYIARVESSMAPQVGEFLSIRGKTYVVKGRTFAVDHADDFAQTAMRCNVDVSLIRKRRSSPTPGANDGR